MVWTLLYNDIAIWHTENVLCLSYLEEYNIFTSDINMQNYYPL